MLFRSLKDVRAGYGEAIVLDGISVDVPKNGALAVLGRNGVGKSTLLLTIMGHTRLHRGDIFWKGENIARVAAHKRALKGLGWVAQEREIFASLSVEENLTVMARPGRWDLGAVYGLFPRLKERQRNKGNQLSGGEQQMLSIARALRTNPSVLLMDEPTEGLAPVIVEALAAAMGKLRDEAGLSIILVEQNSRIALEFSKRCIVLDKGRIVYDGETAPLRADAEKLAALIGVSE